MQKLLCILKIFFSNWQGKPIGETRQRWSSLKLMKITSQGRFGLPFPLCTLYRVQPVNPSLLYQKQYRSQHFYFSWDLLQNHTYFPNWCPAWHYLKKSPTASTMASILCLNLLQALVRVSLGREPSTSMILAGRDSILLWGLPALSTYSLQTPHFLAVQISLKWPLKKIKLSISWKKIKILQKFH